METKQLALFGDEDVVGSGQPHPWPVATLETERETPASDPDQLAFDETETGAAA